MKPVPSHITTSPFRTHDLGLLSSGRVSRYIHLIWRLLCRAPPVHHGLLFLRGELECSCDFSIWRQLLFTYESSQACGDIITKKGLDKHRNQCRGASFSCIDCGVHFQGTEYKNHTSCISEAQKVQGSMYKEKDKKGKGDKRKSVNWGSDSQDMVPRRAYVEDAPEGDDSQAMVVIDVPPKAPSPPPPPAAAVAAEITDGVNVFDFLVTEDTAKETPTHYKTVERAPSEQRVVEHPTLYGNGDYSQYSQYSQYSNGYAPQYMHYGFSYGNSPVPPSYARYDSWSNLGESQQSQGAMAPPYVTPAPKEHRKENKEKDKRVSISDNSEKKRKRHQVEELDLSSAKRPSSRDQPMTDAPQDNRVLHSGLTGGLNKLVTDPEFYEDRIDSGPTPLISPIKRNRRDDDLKKADRRKSSYASYSLVKTKPSSTSRHPDDERNERKKYHDDTHHRRSARSPDRTTYHGDKHRRRTRSADRGDRIYHDDRHRHHHDRSNGASNTRRTVRESISSDDRPTRKHLRVIEYPSDNSKRLSSSDSHRPTDRPGSVQPTASNQVAISYSSRADLFMSFIQKGPDSERGCSINKVLKRYHRERDVRGDVRKEEEDKELWKALRLRRNERGEIVLFV